MSNTRDVLLNGAVGVVTLCTVTLTAMTLFRDVGGSTRPLPSGREPPVLIEDWQELKSAGHRFGPEDADVTVVTFSDFECPVCRSFAVTTFPDFARRYPGRIALVYRHWPLTRHRFAYPAARASECAAAQGRFAEFHDAVYAQQDQLGLKTLREFAAEAGVPDLDTFDSCYESSEPVPSIERDIEAVRNIGGTGTPTVIVNGWLLRGGASPQVLDSISQQFLSRT